MYNYNYNKENGGEVMKKKKKTAEISKEIDSSSIGKEYLTDYNYNVHYIYRALCLAYILGLFHDFEVLENWILNNQTHEEIQSYIELALENKYILQRIERNNLYNKAEKLRSFF